MSSFCEECGKVFSSAANKREHQNAAHSRISFQCPVCSNTFNRSNQFYTHRKNGCVGAKYIRTVGPKNIQTSVEQSTKATTKSLVHQTANLSTSNFHSHF